MFEQNEAALKQHYLVFNTVLDLCVFAFLCVYFCLVALAVHVVERSELIPSRLSKNPQYSPKFWLLTTLSVVGVRILIIF